MKFASEVHVENCYPEIRSMEWMLRRSRSVVVKLWLDITKDEQKKRFLDPLVQGLGRSAFFMTEPAADGGAGSDPSMMQSTAVRDGNHWVINGRKAFITGAEGAMVGIVMAKSSEGACLFLVDLPNPAIRIERVLDTIDRTMPGGHSVVAIDNLRVNADSVLGEVGHGFKYAPIYGELAEEWLEGKPSPELEAFGETKRIAATGLGGGVLS